VREACGSVAEASEVSRVYYLLGDETLLKQVSPQTSWELPAVTPPAEEPSRSWKRSKLTERKDTAAPQWAAADQLEEEIQTLSARGETTRAAQLQQILCSPLVALLPTAPPHLQPQLAALLARNPPP
jgi:hypothetical protein